MLPQTAWAQTQTSTSLFASAATSVFGEPVTFTATVAPLGPGTPTGTVTFVDTNTNTNLGTVGLAGGQAIVTTSTLIAGAPHTILAIYNPDPGFLTSNGSVGITVSAANTTTFVVASPPSSVTGQPVTFTATVTAVAPSTAIPTGTVTFFDTTTGTTLGTRTVDGGGNAILMAPIVTAGSHTIQATFNPNPIFNFVPSSGSVTQTVNPASTTTTVTSSVNPSAFGQPVTFTATVTAQAPSSAIPTGGVTFVDTTTNTTLAFITLTAGGQAFFTSSTLTPGPHVIQVTFTPGDANFLSSTGSVTQTVNPASTTTTVTSSVNPSAIGQPVTFTATVTSAGGGTPTGGVTFVDTTTNTTLAFITLTAGGQAFFTSSTLTPGPHVIQVTFTPGDANFLSSTGSVTQTVNQTGTTTTVTSSVNPSNVGQAVTFTATVASGAGTPTGSVTFTIDGTPQPPVALAAGTAAFTTSALTAGQHSITASYGGAATFAPSTSAILTQTVSLVTTATALTSSVNPSNVGQPVTFTATVTSNAGTPTGTVTFRDGASVLGTATLAAGVATFTTSSLALGAHTITASFGGAAGFAASTSPTLTQTVQIPPDSVRLRALQLMVTKIEAQASGAAFEGAVSGAIADGFAEDGGALVTPNANGVRFNFAAESGELGQGGGRVVEQYGADPGLRASMRDNGLSAINQNIAADGRGLAPRSSSAATRVDDAFNALAYAKSPVTKAPPLGPVAPKEWLPWLDVRGTGWNTDFNAGDIRGGQINAIAGLTRKLNPNLLIGVLGGYENFDYTSNLLTGKLRGDGWTVGGYLGWRIWPGVRFDAAIGRSVIDYQGTSGLAAASFSGHRWLASGGLTGMYRAQWLQIEPSARVYAIWERDDSYVDNLGTFQPENSFSTGRASAGTKLSYPMMWSGTATLSPYVGLYADYYFSSDNAALLLPQQFVQGWAARTTAGLSYSAPGGARLLLGGELGGLGSQTFTTWSVRGRASVPF